MFVISIGKIGEWYMDLLKDNNCYFLVNSYYLEKNNLLKESYRQKYNYLEMTEFSLSLLSTLLDELKKMGTKREY